MAQQILATAAQAILANSGNGQSGGGDDNPANEWRGGGASAVDIRQVEYLLQGGGVIDPVDGDGGRTPNVPEGGSTPIIGGGLR
jgi:hypothetical protein